MSSPHPSILSHPWVYSVTKTDGKITFRVEVTDFQPTAGVVEISGQATQEGGAFAPIYATATVPHAPNGDPKDEDEAGRSFVNVAVTENPAYPFRSGQAVTVFVRVSKAWVTMIGQSAASLSGSSVQPGQVAPEGTTWEDHLADAHISSSILSHPWVYSAKIADGKITFRVEVTDFKPTAGVVEISGQATQEGGAFAPIYGTATVPDAPNGDPEDEDEAGRSFVNVDVTENPAYPFRSGEAVTVFVRVSKAWVTVIGQSTTGGSPLGEPGQPAPDGTIWGDHLADAHIGGPKPSAGSN